jgi:hypothetical protein
MIEPSPENAITPNDAGQAARKLIWASNHGVPITLSKQEAFALAHKIGDELLLELATWDDTPVEVSE